MRISISIKNYLGINLKTAELATVLSKLIGAQLSSTVELDFKGVEFMSRTFADQFYSERMHLRKLGISVFIINMDESIEKTMSAITRIHNNKEESAILQIR